MSRRRRSRAMIGVRLPVPRTTPRDSADLARLLREQPPVPIPAHTIETPRPGLTALELLGHRVIRREGGDPWPSA